MTTVPATDSPLLRMVRETPTDYWNDSCAVAELAYAVERGGTGATSNPVIVVEVMKKEKDHWVPRVREMAAEHPDWSEVELTWALIEEMGARGADPQPVFDAHEEEGRLAPDEPGELPRRRPDGRARPSLPARLAPQRSSSVPAAAGPGSRREAARGVVANITWCSRLPRHRGAEAVERGLRPPRMPDRHQPVQPPVCSLMIGRLDDWLRSSSRKDNIAWTPMPPTGRASRRSSGRRHLSGARLPDPAAGGRVPPPAPLDELVGGDVVLPSHPARQVRFNGSGIDPRPRIDVPVTSASSTTCRIPDFRRAYERMDWRR
jgi:transaldolase